MYNFKNYLNSHKWLVYLSKYYDRKIKLKLFSEKVLFIKSLGLQVSYVYFTGMQSSTFIPIKKLQKIFINEVITMVRKIYKNQWCIGHSVTLHWRNVLH